MKKWMLCLVGVVVLSLTSCLKEDDSDTVYYDLGVVSDISNGYTFLTDNKDTLYTSQSISSTYIALTKGMRVYITYTVLKNGTAAEGYTKKISIENIKEIRVKPIVVLNEVNRDTIGSDASVLLGISIAGKYLNVDFGFYGNNKIHYFNLVYDAFRQDVDGYVVLEFRHKDNDDLMNYTSRGLISYDLSSFEWTGTVPHKFIFRYIDYNSKVQDVKFDYTPPAL